jgi:hypothetical protein
MGDAEVRALYASKFAQVAARKAEYAARKV